MTDVPHVDPLLQAEGPVPHELMLYLHGPPDGGVVHALRTAQRPAVPPLPLEEVGRVVGAHGENDGAVGLAADELAALVPGAVLVVGGHALVDELVDDFLIRDLLVQGRRLLHDFYPSARFRVPIP